MFFSSTLNSDDQNLLAQSFFADQYSHADRFSQNYILNNPYRLIFTSYNPSLEDNCFSTTYVDPTGCLHIQLDKNETEYAFLKLALHKHDYFEIMFVLSGEIYVNIEHERHLYKKGSCYIVNKNVMHTEEFTTDFQIVFLQISTEIMHAIYQELSLKIFDIEKAAPPSAIIEFIANNLTANANTHKAYLDFIPSKEDASVAKVLHDYFDQITRETLSPNLKSSFHIMTLFRRLFLYMSTPDIFSTIPVQIGSDAEYMLYSEIVGAMRETDGRMSRSQLSEKLSYSGAYLNEICKKYSGLSLFDYGMTFCMKKAAHLLASSSDNITDIGYALGFTNKTHFYKIFKETYGMTPAEYRKSHKTQVKK